mgnify:CR=1 FL=1
MKRNIVFYLGVVVVSAMTCAATMLVVGNHLYGGNNEATSYNKEGIKSLNNTTFNENPATDAVFASSVVSTEYPDLTYAAENAVKAVVNIEAKIRVKQQFSSGVLSDLNGMSYSGSRSRTLSKWQTN